MFIPIMVLGLVYIAPPMFGVLVCWLFVRKWRLSKVVRYILGTVSVIVSVGAIGFIAWSLLIGTPYFFDQGKYYDPEFGSTGSFLCNSWNHGPILCDGPEYLKNRIALAPLMYFFLAGYAAQPFSAILRMSDGLGFMVYLPVFYTLFWAFFFGGCVVAWKLSQRLRIRISLSS